MHRHDLWRGNRESAMPSGEQTDPHTLVKSAAVGRRCHPSAVRFAAPSPMAIVLSTLCSRPVETRIIVQARCAMIMMMISGP